MRRGFFGLTGLAAGICLVLLNGCGTDTPGMTNTMGTFESAVNGAPDKVTEAAVGAVKDLRLSSVAYSETKIDGTVSARTAQGDDVKITIEQAGDNVSKVSIKAGAMGDETISKEILSRIKQNLSNPLAGMDGADSATTAPAAP